MSRTASGRGAIRSERTSMPRMTAAQATADPSERTMPSGSALSSPPPAAPTATPPTPSTTATTRAPENRSRLPSTAAATTRIGAVWNRIVASDALTRSRASAKRAICPP
jgi:hypothetical protein